MTATAAASMSARTAGQLRGWLSVRHSLGTEAAGLGPEDLIRPVLESWASDSGKLDNAVELLTRAGRDVRHALAILVPEAWEQHRDMDPELSGFYRFHRRGRTKVRLEWRLLMMTHNLTKVHRHQLAAAGA